jgi:hypothetical protein
MPNIFFSVMQKTFIKCIFGIRVSLFLHSRKKLIRRFQKKKRQHSEVGINLLNVRILTI